jgi:WD40 repeat protein
MRPLKTVPTIEHPTAVKSLLPLPLTELAESYIITGSGDKIRAYDISNVEEPELLGEIEAHAHDVTSLNYWIRAAVADAGKRGCKIWIVSGSLDGTLRKWKLSGRCFPIYTWPRLLIAQKTF